ncbi:MULTISPECIES: macrolide family glycosyltransferase [Amycolatopsis]|uniref:Macrolide-inactivating glycosyltransferase n=1 Tax=Amycolatopsis bullii TaxID=941987 RepID=A0ABQ3KG96_9PSEU|nr:macrolide family glycosyltransferase [Amycolatopsis bullii]GHG20891.1 macrolide-inactivating glycosyltransferase [Amycolatopsis bullii]
MTGHIAFFSFPAYAHIAPTLPVVAELVERGHRVTYAVADRFAGQVAATGAAVLPYDSTFPWEKGLSGAGTRAAMTEMVTSFVSEALSSLPAALDRFTGDVPDLFVHDHAASETARILAKAWDRPVVQTVPTIASSERFSMSREQDKHAAGRPTLQPDDPALVEFFLRQQELLEKFGLGDVDIEGFGAEHGPNIVFAPREFQPFGAEFDPRFAFVGPCFGKDEPDTGGWTPPDGRPVVLVSLGTSYSPGRVEFFKRCAQAFAGTRWHVVMTLGSAIAPADLGPLPANVEPRQWVPHPAVLRHAGVFVTHAGMGSVMEALDAGVPMVCVPQQVDQHVIAGQVAALGLGRTVPGPLDAEELVEAVDAVAVDDRCRAALRAMRTHLRNAGGAGKAAEVLEGCLAGATA